MVGIINEVNPITLLPTIDVKVIVEGSLHQHFNRTFNNNRLR
jgi:hypothetical protein